MRPASRSDYPRIRQVHAPTRVRRPAASYAGTTVPLLSASSTWRLRYRCSELGRRRGPNCPCRTRARLVPTIRWAFGSSLSASELGERPSLAPIIPSMCLSHRGDRCGKRGRTVTIAIRKITCSRHSQQHTWHAMSVRSALRPAGWEWLASAPLLCEPASIFCARRISRTSSRSTLCAIRCRAAREQGLPSTACSGTTNRWEFFMVDERFTDVASCSG